MNRKSPCKSCPWRTSEIGTFPAQAFRISAHTAYDTDDRTFGCHESGHKKPSTCAGFLLRGAEHNLAVRLGKLQGRYLDVLNADGAELFDSYREMAVANGVEPSDPVLTLCRNYVLIKDPHHFHRFLHENGFTKVSCIARSPDI